MWGAGRGTVRHCKGTTPPTYKVEAGEVSEVPQHLHGLEAEMCDAIPESQQLVVQNLLCSFATIFSKTEDDLGLTHLIEHAIDIEDAAPICCPPSPQGS